MKLKIGFTVLLVVLSTISFSSSSASAASCRSSSFGSTYSGLKFKCPDGSSFTVKPDLYGGYTDPYTTYKARDNYGNTLRCKYSEFRSKYTCK